MKTTVTTQTKKKTGFPLSPLLQASSPMSSVSQVDIGQLGTSQDFPSLPFSSHQVPCPQYPKLTYVNLGHPRISPLSPSPAHVDMSSVALGQLGTSQDFPSLPFSSHQIPCPLCPKLTKVNLGHTRIPTVSQVSGPWGV